jgi:hypothetical protein
MRGIRHQKVTALRDLNKLTIGPRIQVTKCGSFYKARFEGRSDFVFGATAEEATSLLRSGRLPRGKYRGKFCDD